MRLGCTQIWDHLDDRLLRCIAQRKPPRNPKEVLLFLGLCGYFRRFVRDYAKIAEPLTRLTRKDQPLCGAEEQESAFQTLKERLISYPILRRPDPDSRKEYVVYCDASTIAVGCIVCQKEDESEGGREYVVAYHSRKLNNHQVNYSISELECFVVVEALTQFRPLLYGTKFQVVTDHAALKTLLSTKQFANARLARWSILLADMMPCTVEYRKGSMHKSVDALTRDPTFYDEEAEQQQPSLP